MPRPERGRQVRGGRDNIPLFIPKYLALKVSERPSGFFLTNLARVNSCTAFISGENACIYTPLSSFSGSPSQHE